MRTIVVVAIGLAACGFPRLDDLPTTDANTQIPVDGSFDAGVSVSFATHVDFAMGSAPSHLAIADFNNDGKPDVVVGSFTQEHVSVAINITATGATTPSFTSKISLPIFTTSAFPGDLAIGDLNADGKADLVVVNAGAANSVSVFLGTTTAGASTATFAPRVEFTTASGPSSVVIGDFNGDGKLDLVVECDVPAELSILRNTTATGATTPSFATKVDVPVSGSFGELSVGDLNGDGKPDLASSNLSGNSASVLLNTTATGSTTFTFGAKVDFPTGAFTVTTAIGDVNKGGNLDLVASSNNSIASVFLNTTTIGASLPSFAGSVSVPSGGARSTLADIDGDTRTDIVVANATSNTVSVSLNTTATGATTATFAAKVTFATGEGPQAIAAADVNGDGKRDLITANDDSNNVSVLLAQ